MDVLDQGTNAMVRFVAPVTMLATGGCGQVRRDPLLCSSSLQSAHLSLLNV